MSQTPAVTLQSVSRSFGARLVFSALDLKVAPGERIALHGQNGSGKTTLLRIIAGTLTASSGSAFVGAAAAGTLAAKAQVGVALTQGRGLYGRLSARDNLMLFARLRMPERDARAAVEGLERELRLAEIAPVRVDRCSAGMLAQVSFARALLGNPLVLLLDEPTRSLDTDARARLWAALDARKGTSAIIATHDPVDLDRCAQVLEL